MATTFYSILTKIEPVELKDIPVASDRRLPDTVARKSEHAVPAYAKYLGIDGLKVIDTKDPNDDSGREFSRLEYTAKTAPLFHAFLVRILESIYESLDKLKCARGWPQSRNEEKK